MKLFSLTIWLIFGYIISIENNNRIYDIIYSAEYIVDVEKVDFSSENNLFFRLKVDSNEKMELKLEVKGTYSLKNVKALGFSEYPYEEDIINAKSKFQQFTTYMRLGDEKDSETFFPIEGFTDPKYLVIYISTSSSLQYLSILVSPSSTPNRRESLLFKEIKYNQEFIVDSETLNNYESCFSLWFKNENLEDGVIKIKLHKDDVNDLMIFLLGTENPPQRVLNNSDILEYRLISENTNTTDSNYTTYKYNYKKFTEKSKYIVFSATSFMSRFKYFSVYIGKEQEEQKEQKEEQKEQNEPISNELPNSYKISGLNAYSLFALLLLLLF